MVAVDISRWQGVIPVGVFRLWKAAGVSRVLLKLGGGDSGRYKDSCYDTNYQNATVAGLITEGYWFNGTTDPAGDAIFAHAVATPGMRIWADVESEGSMPNWTPLEAFAFMSTAQSLGHRTGLYMSTSVTARYDWSPFSSRYPLWVADYRGVSFPPVSYWTRAQTVYWQYTDAGHLPGYSGKLDLDYDYNTNTPAIPVLVPGPSLLEDHPMYFIQHAASGAIAVIFPWLFDGVGGYRHVTAPEWAAALAGGAKFAALSDSDWSAIMAGMKPISGVVGK